MDPSSAHQQIMSEQTLETMLACSKAQQQQDDPKKPRPQPEQALKCPRCDSTNTKFCYYNNYSLTQPRYFCKSCRRYWTKGGTLRNVPVGGGCRKNKRSSSSSTKRSGQDQAFINTNHHNINNNPFSCFPQLSYYDSSNDFALAIAARLQKGQQLGFDDHHDLSILGSTISSPSCDILGLNNNNDNINSVTATTGFLDALRSGFLGTPNNNNNNNVQNLYYGGYENNNNGDMGEVVDNNGGGDMNMVLTYDQEINDTTVSTTQAVTVTTMKQETCSGDRELLLQSSDHNSSWNNRVLWGFPWQMNGSLDHTNMGEFDSARASCWNNLNSSSSSWHGLLNSPLM